MITINTAESALRNIYLESVIHDINEKTNPFLTMIRKNTKTIAERDAKAAVRFGSEGSVAAGEEDSILPTAHDARQAEIVTPLKNLYGTFQITDKAIRAAQNSPGAFTALVGGEMKNLVATAQTNLNRMVYGSGNPFLAYTLTHNAPTRTFQVPARFRDNLRVGQQIVVMNSNNQVLNTNVIKITNVVAFIPDSSRLNVVYTGDVPATKFDRLYLFPAEQSNLEMNGVDSLFMQDRLYNLKREDYKEILPFTSFDSGEDLNIINEDVLIEFFDGLEEHAQGQVSDIILTHPNVRKALFENLRDTRNNIDVTEFAGGFRGFTFNGIPMYADIRCMAGTAYALHSESFAMQQLCDWTWLEGDDGSILRPISGKSVYSATLVKYADLVCEKPFLQGKLTGYSALQWK
ncbi:MAG: phage major capsid protein [Firmicutes bacterium]|nr:phage major capsid protein [Bacillota bacterium]